MQLRNQPFAFIIPFSCSFLFMDVPGMQLLHKLLVMAGSVGLFFLMRRTSITAFIRNTGAGTWWLFAAAVLYAGFAFVGHPLFFTAYPVPHAVLRAVSFVLFCSWLSFPAIAFLYFMDWCARRLAFNNSLPNTQRVYSTARLYTIFSCVLLVGWLLYFIGFYPGNMSVDSFVQYRQALGMEPLTDVHPVFHTLVMRALLLFWTSPAIITLFQIVFMTAVVSSFLVFLYKAGVPYTLLLILVILTALLPPNGIMVTVLWKDIPYCCSLLWLTLVLAELVTGKYIFNYKITLVCLVASLTGVALFRHNGNLAALIVALFLVAWAVTNRRKGIWMATSLFLLVFAVYKKWIVPSWLHVQPVQTAFTTTPLVHGIASVIYYNGELSADTKQQMEAVLPADAWKSNYNPYSADEYLFMPNTDFIGNLSKVPVSKVVGMYAHTFVHHPFLIARDRLAGCEVMWNAFQGEGASNYSFHPEITENDLHIAQHDTVLKKVLMGMVKFSGRALDPLSRRAGLYNVALLLLMVYAFRRRTLWLAVFVPLLGANFSLLLSMTYQSYRYVYYAPLLFWFMLLLVISPLFASTGDTKN